MSSQVHPAVESVSAEAGSLAGGHVLHIRGRGFGNMADAVRVDISGMPCQVLSTVDSVITCLTSPWEPSVSNRTTFSGGAGIHLTQFTGSLSAQCDTTCAGVGIETVRTRWFVKIPYNIVIAVSSSGALALFLLFGCKTWSCCLDLL